MSRNERFVRLYRGLNEVEPNDVNHQMLGIHWTEHPDSAINFALNNDMYGYAHESYEEPGEEEHEDKGTVLEALVHKRHLVNPETEEWHNLADTEAIQGPESMERETTVRPGAPVYVVRKHLIGRQFENYQPKDYENPIRGRA